MLLHFYKMTGAGNDFVMLDNRDLSLTPHLDAETIEALCNRRFGIGADGLLAVEPARGQGDFRMRYYNADGSEADMCGNGARCFAAFASALSGEELGDISFETAAGLIRARFEDDGNVTISLTTPKDLQINILPPDDIVPAPVHFVNTGVPHAVVFLPSVEELDIVEIGSYLRNHQAFSPPATKTNIPTVLNPQPQQIRTYERGVEDETLACGTGMTATALLHAALTNAPSPIKLDVAGGDTLSIGFKRDGLNFTDVTLTGPALFVFEGDIELTGEIELEQH